MAALNMLNCPKAYGRSWGKSFRKARSKTSFPDIAESGNTKNGYSSNGFGKIEASGNSRKIADISGSGKNDGEISAPLLKFIFEEARAIESLNSPTAAVNKIDVHQSCIGNRQVTNSLHQEVNKTGTYRTSGFLNPIAMNGMDEHGGLLNHSELELGKDLQSKSLLCRRIEEDLCRRLHISSRSEFQDGQNCFATDQRKGCHKCKSTDDRLGVSPHQCCEYASFNLSPQLENKPFHKCLYQSPNPRGRHSGNLNFDSLVTRERYSAANQRLNASESVECSHRRTPSPDQGIEVDSSPNSRCGNLCSDPLFIGERCDAENKCLNASNSVEFPNLPSPLPDQGRVVDSLFNPRSENPCFDPLVDSERCGAATQHLNASSITEFPNRLSALPDHGSVVDTNQQKFSPPVKGRDWGTTQLDNQPIDIGNESDLHGYANNQSFPKNRTYPLYQKSEHGFYNPQLEQESKNFDKYSLLTPNCQSGGSLFYNRLFTCTTCGATNLSVRLSSQNEFLHKLLSLMPDPGNGALQQTYLLPDARNSSQLPEQLLDIESNFEMRLMTDSISKSESVFPSSNPNYEDLHSIWNFSSAQDSVASDEISNKFNPVLEQNFENALVEA